MEDNILRYTFDELASLFTKSDPPSNKESFLSVFSPECQPPLDQSLYSPIKQRKQRQYQYSKPTNYGQYIPNRKPVEQDINPTRKAASSTFAPLTQKQSEELMGYNSQSVPNDNTTFQSVINHNQSEFQPYTFAPHPRPFIPDTRMPVSFTPDKLPGQPVIHTYAPQPEDHTIPTHIEPSQIPEPVSQPQEDLHNENTPSQQGETATNMADIFYSKDNHDETEQETFTPVIDQVDMQENLSSRIHSRVNEIIEEQRNESNANQQHQSTPMQNQPKFTAQWSSDNRSSNSNKPQMNAIFASQNEHSMKEKQREEQLYKEQQSQEPQINAQWPLEHKSTNSNRPQMDAILATQKEHSMKEKQHEEQLYKERQSQEPKINAQWPLEHKSTNSNRPQMDAILATQKEHSMKEKQREEQLYKERQSQEPKINAQWPLEHKSTNSNRPQMDAILATQKEHSMKEKQREEQLYKERQSKEPKISGWTSISKPANIAPSIDGIIKQEELLSNQTKAKPNKPSNTATPKSKKNQRGQVIDIAALNKQTTPAWNTPNQQSKAAPVGFKDIENEQKQKTNQQKKNEKTSAQPSKKKQQKTIPLQTLGFSVLPRNQQQSKPQLSSPYFCNSSDDEEVRPHKPAPKRQVPDMKALFQEEERKQQNNKQKQKQNQSAQRITTGPRIQSNKTDFNSLLQNEQMSKEAKNNASFVPPDNYEIRQRKPQRFDEIEQEEKRNFNHRAQYQISDEVPQRSQKKKTSKQARNDDLFWGDNDADQFALEDTRAPARTQKKTTSPPTRKVNDDDDLFWGDDDGDQFSLEAIKAPAKPQKTQKQPKKERNPAQYLTNLLEDAIEDGEDYSEFAEALVSKDRNTFIQSLKTLSLTVDQAVKIADKFFRQFPSQ